MKGSEPLSSLSQRWIRTLSLTILLLVDVTKTVNLIDYTVSVGYNMVNEQYPASRNRRRGNRTTILSQPYDAGCAIVGNPS